MSKTPLSYISPLIVKKLEHLRLSNSLDISSAELIGSGGFSDVYKHEYRFPGESTNRAIAIKRLRIIAREDYIMVRIKKKVYNFIHGLSIPFPYVLAI